MRLLDDLMNKATAAVSGGDGAASPMLSHVTDLLKNNSFGGLSGLVQAFHDKGLGGVVSSWISTGQNLPVSGAQIQQVLGNSTLQALAAKAGITPEKMQEGLATLLPQVIDKLTPHGQLPATHQDGDHQMKMHKMGIALAVLMFAFVVAPAAASAQAAAKMVSCTDGSKSKSGRGACSGHGGVAEAAPAKAAAPAAAKMDAPAKAPAKSKSAAKSKAAAAPAATAKKAPEAAAPKAASAAPKAGEGKPTAKCTDGTMSYAKNHTGACSSHGGVAEWLDGTKKP